jgi:deoxyxylulose-5-phosphate synthase
VRMGVADEIVTHGDPKVLLARYGLDADGIRRKVIDTIRTVEDTAAGSNRLRAVK